MKRSILNFSGSDTWSEKIKARREPGRENVNLKFKTKFEYGSFRRGYIKGEERKKRCRRRKIFQIIKQETSDNCSQWTEQFHLVDFLFGSRIYFKIFHSRIHTQANSRVSFLKIIEKKTQRV